MAGKHPLEATLALRAMIEFALDQSRTSRYKHPARHLLECVGLAANIDDFGKHETADARQTRQEEFILVQHGLSASRPVGRATKRRYRSRTLERTHRAM
nr:DUF6880 family protein [Methylosinus sp. Ce-a6]